MPGHLINLRDPLQRHAMALANWDFKFERQVQPHLDRVATRLGYHRKVQGQIARGEALVGYYRSAAHSRAEVVEVIRIARAKRDDFLRRWPMPVAPVATDTRKAA